MIELHPFTESDFGELIAEITDARFLLQWAGPQYAYPLDVEQLRASLGHAIGEKPTLQIFKAVRPDTSEVVGHIQLMDIDYNAMNCVIGRVLIFQKHRGKSWGQQMVEAAVAFAFEKLGLSEVLLGVFDFNTPAILTYRRIGFSEIQCNWGARPFQNESWNLIKMKLAKNSWLHRNGANPC